MPSSDIELELPKPAPATGWKADLMEVILDDIGGTFQRYQIINYILFCLPFALSGSFGLSYVFTALDVDYRCFIPECETLNQTPGTTNIFQPDWLSNAVQFTKGKPSKCERYDIFANANTSECRPDIFDHSKTVGCQEYIYKTNEISILNEFHLECDDDADDAAWKLSLVGSVNGYGRLIFLPIMGLLSDRYGRRTVLIAGVLGSSIFAYIRSFAPNYMAFIVFEFLDAGIGSLTYSASFTLAMEWIGVCDRILLGSIVTATYPLGQIFLGFTAKAVKNYRQLLQIIYGPGFLILLYFWIAPESMRWLIANGKKRELLATLKRAERINGLKLSPDTIDRINIEVHEHPKPSADCGDGHTDSKWTQFKTILTTRSLLIRFLICAFAWITCSYVSYGISVTSTSLPGDIYVNFVVVAIAGVPAMLFVYFLMEACGRRWTLILSLLIGGTCIIASKLMPSNFTILSITLFFIGKCFITVAFTGLYVYTNELWPTSIRHTMMGLCSALGRIGSSFAPMARLLSKYFDILPYLTFGVMAVIASILIVKLPETLKRKLPDTLSEAERIGRESVDETS